MLRKPTKVDEKRSWGKGRMGEKNVPSKGSKKKKKKKNGGVVKKKEHEKAKRDRSDIK